MELQQIIYQHLVEQENQRLICCNKIEETKDEENRLDEAILDTKNRLEVKLINGECSQFIIEQIARRRLNIGENFNGKIEFYNASQILDIIELLEKDKISSDDFNRQILNGFSKTHHGTYSGLGYSIARNIKEYWFKKGKIRLERQDEFQQITSNFEKHGISTVLNMMHSSAMGNRELRGEWIIFKKHNGKKYYLCLACHNEVDDLIFENKLVHSLTEFPELLEDSNNN